jgi:hypothetical protein
MACAVAPVSGKGREMAWGYEIRGAKAERGRVTPVDTTPKQAGGVRLGDLAACMEDD